MKENLKVLNIDGATEWHEVKSLFFSLGFSSVISGLTLMFTDKQRLPCRDITLPELRELARPKEYLNDKFELVVTNQPEDGFILVPDGAEYFVKGHGSEALFFYKQDGEYMAWKMPQGKNWNPSSHTSPTTAFIILWQRENKVETAKGRFLHQWAYEAFGRGEELEHTPCERDCDWTSTSIASPISIFSAREMKFRLKPQTIQIGSRTIVKPISVKPEIGTEIYASDTVQLCKYYRFKWSDDKSDYDLLNRNICHLTAFDAINHAEAFLELMK